MSEALKQLVCKTRENSKISKNGKMIIKIINNHKDSEMPLKFSRSRTTKWTASLNSSREI